MKFFDKIKNKSPKTKQKIAGVAAIVVTAGVFMFWLVDLGNNFSQAETAEQANSASPFKALKDSFSSFFSEAGSTIEKGISIFSFDEDMNAEQNSDNVEIVEVKINEPDETEVGVSANPGLPENIDDLDKYFEIVGDEPGSEDKLEISE